MAVTALRLGSGTVTTNRLGGLTIEKYTLAPATFGTDTNWFFSEKGAGIKPLLFVGSIDEIMAFLMLYRQKKFISQTPDLPNLYAGLAPFSLSDKKIEVTSPVGDMMVKMTRQIATGISGVIFENLEAGIKNIQRYEFLSLWRNVVDAAVKTDDIKNWIKLQMGIDADLKKKNQFALSIYNMPQKSSDRWFGFREAYFSDVLLSVFKNSQEYKARSHIYEEYINESHDNN